MPRGQPVEPATRARIKDLHSQGRGRNDIAREIGISGYTVTKVCREEGLSFDREATKAATEAKVIDNRARRQNAIARFYDQTDKVFDRLDRERHQLKEVSAGKLVEYESEDLPAQDLRALIQAANASITSAVKLEQVDVSDGSDHAKSLIGGLMDGLRNIYEQGQTDPECPPDVGK